MTALITYAEADVALTSQVESTERQIEQEVGLTPDKGQGK